MDIQNQIKQEFMELIRDYQSFLFENFFENKEKGCCWKTTESYNKFNELKELKDRLQNIQTKVIGKDREYEQF